MAEIAQLLNAEVVGDREKHITGINSLDKATDSDLSFLANAKYSPLLNHSKAGAILVSKSFEVDKNSSTTFLLVDDPYLALTHLLTHYEQTLKKSLKGREEPHVIGGGTAIGDNVYIGAFAYIGKSCQVGSHCEIHPQVYIGDEVVIGERSIVYAGAKIYSRTIIGTDCTIHAGAVIGSAGFGFAPDHDGNYTAIPQIGHVVLEDNVSVGANTTIDRATFDVTHIHKGVKIDNLVQIAHNVTIKKNTVIASQVGISGSTEIGAHCQIGGQAGFQGHIKVADNTKIGGQAGVISDIKTNGQTVFGTPAMDKTEYLKAFAGFKKLPEILARITKLEGGLGIH